MSRTFLVCAILFFSFANAQSSSLNLKIKQILSEENIAVVTGDDLDMVEVGHIFLATFADESQCSMSVKNKNEGYVTLSLNNCAKKNELRVNQSLEKSLYQNDIKASQPEVMKSPDLKVDSDSSAISGSEDIQSVARITPVGLFDLSLETNVVNTKTDIKGVVSSNGRSNLARGEINYGVNGWLNVGLNASYILTKTIESPGADSISGNGIQDPTMLVSVQPVKQTHDRPFNIIAGMRHSPKVIANESGNGGKGYSSTQSRITVSRYLQSAEIGFSVLYNYYSEGSGKFKDGTSWDSTGYDGYLFGIYSQVRASSFLSFWGGVAFGQDSEQQQMWKKASTGDWALQINSYNYTLLKAGIKFVMIPQVSFISFEVENQKVNDGSGWIKNNTTVSGNIDKLEGTAYSLNWTYRL